MEAYTRIGRVANFDFFFFSSSLFGGGFFFLFFHYVVLSPHLRVYSSEEITE